MEGFEWLRLTSIPRLEDTAEPRRWMAASVNAALVTAHAQLLGAGAEGIAAPSLAVSWVRPSGSAEVHFLMGGRPAFPPARPASGSGQVPVLFPPGAAAERVPSRRVQGWIGAVDSWMRCLATMDVELPEPEAPSGAPTTAGLDDYAVHMAMPFIWLVVAEPVTRATLDEEIEAVNTQVTLLRRRDNSEAHRLELERGQRRIRQFTRARANGLWRVHVLAGGSGAVGAQQAASLLCSAMDVGAAGQLLLPGTSVGPLDNIWEEPEQGPDRSVSPFLAGAEAVTTLVRPPVRELPGIRAVTPFRFDVTPVDATAGGVVLGEVLDEGLSPVGRMTVPHDTLNRHGFICGATGSGKSQTARRILESLSSGRPAIPWLVVEPAKAEYARMAGRLPPETGLLVIRPGDLSAPPASLNPLEPEPGFPLQSHADFVRALFLAAFEADEPFPQVLSHALTDCYQATGWDLVTGDLRRPTKLKYRDDEPDQPAPRRYPTLRELQATARRVVDRIGYGPEVAANVRGFVDVRIGSLRQGTPGRFFEGGHPLDVGALLERNVVIELETITNDQDKAFLMGTLLIRLVEHLRVRRPSGSVVGLRHVLLIEEAHRLLKNTKEGPAAAAVELFSSLLAEIRAYGEGVIVVEQTPSKIVPDVLKNTALKVMHRLPALDDRLAVGATMNLDESNSQSVVALPPGHAAVSVDGDDHPLLVRVPGGMSREIAGGDLIPPLAGRRSSLCGGSCQDRACRLAEIAAASALADDPRVVVWSESVAACMALGRSPLMPRAEVIGALVADPRSVECALATLADRAAEARQTQLRRWVDPSDFAARHCALIGAALAGQRWPRGVEHRRWSAGKQRYAHVHFELKKAVEVAGGQTKAEALPGHAAAEDWRRHGLDLTGVSLGEQFTLMKNHPSQAPGSNWVVLGDTATSGFRAAVIELGGGYTVAGLTRALRYVCDSPTERLVASLTPLLSEKDVASGK